MRLLRADRGELHVTAIRPAFAVTLQRYHSRRRITTVFGWCAGKKNAPQGIVGRLEEKAQGAELSLAHIIMRQPIVGAPTLSLSARRALRKPLARPGETDRIALF